jgi:hypothetical protein
MSDGPATVQQEQLHRIEALLIKQHAENGNHWHVKKEVTVAHILSTIGVVGLVVASWFSLSAAVAGLQAQTENVSEARLVAVETRLTDSELHTTVVLNDIKIELRSMNSRLNSKLHSHVP